MRISVIVAMDRNGLIGNEQGLPWRLPRDLRRFRDLTMGKPIIMGRTTHEHIGRPLPGRHNLVLTRRHGHEFLGCTMVHSFEEALQLAETTAEEVFVIGGGKVYREALPLADRIYLTVIDGIFAGATHFPCDVLQAGEWVVTQRELCAADEKNSHCHLFFVLDRKESGMPSGSLFDLKATLAGSFTA